MSVQQINISYDPKQDRLKLRLADTDSKEYAVWLTRRLVSRLLPAVAQRLRETAMAETESGQRSLAAFEHQTAVENSDFSTGYAENLEPALEGGPILAKEIRFGLRDGGNAELQFFGDNDEQMTLTLTTQFIHGFIRLLNQGIETAEWGIEPKGIFSSHIGNQLSATLN